MSATSPIDKASEDYDDPSRSEDIDDNGRERGGKGKPAPKGKDLSHVPCKFFKVGSCTAGASCPFSHTAIETGQKDVCTWFVKGNCKFGHKCALAHVLPGQPMSMDRKNKKAAQAATGGPGARDGGRTRGSKGRGGGNVNGQGRNPLLSGSTAPTRVLSGAARPSPFKTSISPSAPAPPVKDTDFISYGLPDEPDQLSSAPAHGKSPQIEVSDVQANTPDIETVSAPKSPLSPHPLNTTSAPRRVAKPTSPGGDFGPIGSPRSASSSHGAQLHGLSPGTSPSRGGGFVSTSPFSAPGHQSTFMQFERSTDDFRSRAGLAASLGATKTLAGLSSRVGGMRSNDSAVEEEDLEEFLPGSLTDLLTPEEKSRRLSRTNASRPVVGGWDANQRPNDALQHRHSHSVPAPSLLGEVRSIWAEPGAVAVGSPDQRSAVGGGLGNGTPSSFKSTSTFGGRTEDPLSPSNASAAFLPGMHQYLGNRTGQQRSARPTNSLHPSAKPGIPSSNPSSHSPYLGVNGHGLPPSHLNSFGNHSLETGPVDPYTAHDYSGRSIPHRDEDPRIAISPSARALQAHAPGQSLPQGLAAGYSRIHALPPTAMSPPTSGAFSPPKISGFAGSGIGWDESPGSQGGNLDAAMSRISYSTAAARTPSGQQLPSGVRHTSGRGYGPGPFSPLSKPVVTGDDDDLFSMDG